MSALTDIPTEEMLISALLRYPVKAGALCMERRVHRGWFSDPLNATLYLELMAIYVEGKPVARYSLALRLKAIAIDADNTIDNLMSVPSARGDDTALHRAIVRMRRTAPSFLGVFAAL